MGRMLDDFQCFTQKRETKIVMCQFQYQFLLLVPTQAFIIWNNIEQ